jgi:hypothetical protein
MKRLVFLALLLAGCGGGSKAYVPVDSPLKQWEAPEPPEPPAEQPAPEAR